MDNVEPTPTIAAILAGCADAETVVFDAFADGLYTEPRLDIVEWAERNIVISKGPEQGPIRISARTPYLEEILRSFVDIMVSQVTFLASTQVAKTTAMNIALGYVIDQAPGDTLYVMPTEKTAKHISKTRLKPMLFSLPVIQRHFTDSDDDRSNLTYTFDKCVVRFGWAQSDASLAMDSCQYLFADEVGKYETSGENADAISLATERQKNYYNASALIASSPEEEGDEITTQFKAGDRRYYNVPCPHCGAYQVLRWQQVKWPKDERNPQKIKLHNLAWYECEHCRGRITDAHKPEMMARGIWCPEEARVVVDADGVPHIEGAPETTHRSYHIWSAYSPWIRFCDIVAMFLKSERKGKLRNFVNGWLGEGWIVKALDVRLEDIERLRTGYALGTVPEGVCVITAGIDVQKDHCWYVVRGWGVGLESWLIAYGKIDASELQGTVDADVEATKARLESMIWTRGDESLMITMAAWDSGHRNHAVYKACRAAGHMMKPIKGANRRIPSGYEVTSLERSRSGKHIGNFRLYHLDTHYYKDWIDAQRRAQPTTWHLPNDVDTTYMLQQSSEHKILRQNAKGRPVEEWVLKAENAGNHLWDCEVYARAAVSIYGEKNIVPRPKLPVMKPPAPGAGPAGQEWYKGW